VVQPNPDVVLRPAVAGDEPFIRQAWYDAAFPPGFERPPIEVTMEIAELWHYIDGWPRPGDVGVVAEQDGRPVGAAWCRLLPADDPGYGWVDAETPELVIAVVDGLRGRGIGRMLLRALARAAADHGYERLCLSVSQDNPGAVALYLAEGYRVVGLDDGGSLTMVRPLETPNLSQ
jgi:GNAT superfamily N-acetyltransferase